MLLPLVWTISLLLQATTGIVPDASRQQAKQAPDVAAYTAMAEPPKLPKVDLNSCPFEGCQFGTWTAMAKVIVYSTWESGRKPIATLAKNEQVTALTGVNVVLRPGKGIFDRDVPLYGATRGDTAYMYQQCGEGAVDMWVHGRFIKCAEPLFSWAPGEGCRKNCDGRWLSLDKSEWWAQIRLKDGSTGWVQAMGKFEGTDALSYRRD